MKTDEETRAADDAAIIQKQLTEMPVPRKIRLNLSSVFSYTNMFMYLFCGYMIFVSGISILRCSAALWGKAAKAEIIAIEEKNSNNVREFTVKFPDPENAYTAKLRVTNASIYNNVKKGDLIGIHYFEFFRTMPHMDDVRDIGVMIYLSGFLCVCVFLFVYSIYTYYWYVKFGMPVIGEVVEAKRGIGPGAYYRTRISYRWKGNDYKSSYDLSKELPKNVVLLIDTRKPGKNLLYDKSVYMFELKFEF